MKFNSQQFIILSFFIFSSLFGEEFKMSNKVIKANISYQHLNRISVKNDKIDSVLGIESAFYFEKHEKTGNIFIRPTDDNGHSQISLSIVTTSGKTQDLLLNVVAGESCSIELISDNITKDLCLDGDDGSDFNSLNDYEELVSSVMKKFITTVDLPDLAVTGVNDRLYKHLNGTFESAHRIDGFLCLKYKITTSEDGVFSLNEKMFAMRGDVSLSLSAFSISNKSIATLYVLRR